MSAREIGIRIAALIILITIMVMAVLEYKAQSVAPVPLEVVDKCEVDGKCYIETWIEVDPMDYIGLDIGDEYTVKE